MADYMKFSELVSVVSTAIGAVGQVSRDTEIKAIINQVYLNEILCCDPLHPLYWLLRLEDNIRAKARATITGITAANPVVVTAAAHGFVDGDLVTLYGVEGMTEVNNRTFLVVKDSANAFHLHTLEGTDVNGTAFAAYTSGGYAHHRGVKLATTDKTVENIVSVDWVGYPGQFKPIGIQELDGGSTDFWGDSLSRPTRWMPKKVFSAAGAETFYLLWFWCPDQTYHGRAWGEFRPSRLVNDDDVPILPFRFHPTIVAGAITRLGENKAQVESGVIWPQIFKMDLEAIRQMNRAWWRDNAPDERSGIYLL